MKKIYHLSTCDTCQRIIKELQLSEDFERQDIKTQPMTEKQVEEMKNLAASYEALFSKRARLFRQQGHHGKKLSEADYKRLILAHYTFLKRPVIIIGNKLFAGNSKKVVAAAKASIHS